MIGVGTERNRLLQGLPKACQSPRLTRAAVSQARVHPRERLEGLRCDRGRELLAAAEPAEAAAAAPGVGAEGASGTGDLERTQVGPVRGAGDARRQGRATAGTAHAGPQGLRVGWRWGGQGCNRPDPPPSLSPAPPRPAEFLYQLRCGLCRLPQEMHSYL